LVALCPATTNSGSIQHQVCTGRAALEITRDNNKREISTGAHALLSAPQCSQCEKTSWLPASCAWFVTWLVPQTVEGNVGQCYCLKKKNQNIGKGMSSLVNLYVLSLQSHYI
jgi:hypothetical protein